MSLGSRVLKFRQKFGHGLRVAYWRDVVRPRILRTAPVTDLVDDRCEVHALTCGADWLNLIWTLKSFYAASKRRYKLCIHEDGTVGGSAVDILAKHFPSARIIQRCESDPRLAAKLSAYPRTQEFRETNLFALKLLDPVEYLEARCILLLDSDILFFEAPDVLLQRADDPSYGLNCFNPDVDTGYTITPDMARALFGVEMEPRLNAGLGLVQPQSVRLDWIEEFLSAPAVPGGYFWRIEQTLVALLAARYGLEMLPWEYRVHLGRGIGHSPCRHYVGAVRHLMYSEGMRRLVREGFLR